MTTLKSLEDLKRVKEQALEKRRATATSGRAQIVVGMGTVGIAAGTRETGKAFWAAIEEDNLSGIIVRQTGNIGLDSWEPVVQVTVGGEPTVIYGKVTPAVARRIVKEHVMEGKVLSEFVIAA